MKRELGLHVEKLTTLEEFSALYNEPGAMSVLYTENIFLTRLWLTKWWQVYGEGYKLHILIVRDGDRLIGALPLVFRKCLLGVKSLTFMGAGELTPDDLDILSVPERRAEVLHALAEYLHAMRSKWDMLTLDKLSVEGFTSQEFASSFRLSGCATKTTVVARCYYVELPATNDEYLSRLPKTILRNLTRRKRNLDCDYPGLEFRRVNAPEQLQKAFEKLIQFHQTRWADKGYPGSFSSPCFQRFHREIIAEALEAGFLQLFCLQCGSAIIGVFYCYRIGDTMQAYQCGYDECWASYGIGSLMIWKIIESSILDGVGVFDFLEGDETYKEDWATSVRENVRLCIYGSTLRGRLAYAASRLVDFAMNLATRLIPQKTRHSMWKMFLRWKASRARKRNAAYNKMCFSG